MKREVSAMLVHSLKDVGRRAQDKPGRRYQPPAAGREGLDGLWPLPTVPSAGQNARLQYRNRLEACHCIGARPFHLSLRVYSS